MCVICRCVTTEQSCEKEKWHQAKVRDMVKHNCVNWDHRETIDWCSDAYKLVKEIINDVGCFMWPLPILNLARNLQTVLSVKWKKQVVFLFCFFDEGKTKPSFPFYLNIKWFPADFRAYIRNITMTQWLKVVTKKCQ